MLNKLQTVGPSLAVFLEPLVHFQNVASLSFLFWYYFGSWLSELAKITPLLRSGGRATRHSNRLHVFFSPYLDVIRGSMSTVSFLAQLCLQNVFL